MNLFEKNPTPLRAFREAEEKSARKKARAARWRRSWPRRAAGWLGDILRGPDRAPAGGPEAPAGSFIEPVPDHHAAWEALTNAQILARRAGLTDLANALHAVFLLDLTGNLADMAPLVASVRSSLQSALGDDPGAVN